MANHSFNFFVSFSVNDGKENVEILNDSPFWQLTHSFIYFYQLTVQWMRKFFVPSCKCWQQRLRSWWALFICSVLMPRQLAGMYSFRKYLLFFSINGHLFLHKIGLARKARVYKTVTKRPRLPLWWWKLCFERMKLSTTVNHFTINHAVLTPWSLFSPLKSLTLGYSCRFKKFSLMRHPVHDSDFVLLYINRLAQWIFNNYSSSPNGLWVNSPWGRRPNGLLTQRPWGREE